MTPAAPSTNVSGIIFFVLFLALSLAITWWAARRTRSTDEFLAAGRRITAFQNGLALAGDFMAASSFLGVSGVAALIGFDGMVYAVATIMGWPLMMFLLAEPLRNLGKYTAADVLAYRFGRPSIRVVTAISTICIVFGVLTFQMAGAGSVVRLLFGLRYDVSVAGIGVFMLIYVLFGGMIATTWVQIIKCVLMLGTTVVILFLVLAAFHFDLGAIFAGAAARNGPAVLAPGGGMTSVVEVVSLGLAISVGVASLPQVWMRFFTVRDATVARHSMLYATTLVAVALLMFCTIGFGAMALVGTPAIKAADPGGNMAIPLVAEKLAGVPFLGFVAAVTVATVLAAVCGVVIAGAATLSHDLWIGAIRRGKAKPGEQLIVAKLSTVVLCLIGIILAITFEGQNVAFLSAVAATIGASTNFPALVLAIFWPRLTFAGTVAGMVVGLLATLLMIYMSPLIQIGILHHATAIIGLRTPAIVTIPLAFAVSIIVSLLTKPEAVARPYAEVERHLVLGLESS